MRDGAEVLALPLKNLINLSIKLSTFPEECKIAKLKPIFKNGARADPKNYRLISFLPLISKLIEKSIHFQIEDHLNRKKLIYMSPIAQTENFWFVLIMFFLRLEH